MRTLYIGDYFEAELGSGTTFPVFVPDLDNTGLPNKFYLPIVKNGAGAGAPPPANPGNGFYFTHPIHPNQSAITWRMYYTTSEQRMAMRISHGPTTSPYPAPGATQDEVYYLLGDHLGSTTVTVNLDGTVKSRVRYDAWGKTRYTSGTTPTDRKYTGQIEEATVGLYFYNARWYDPSLGRFVQADTIISDPYSSHSWNRYSYVNNNPINYNDPSGRRECESSTGYDCDWETPYLWNRAEKILQALGGKNDLKAMAEIINEGARVYKEYNSLLPALSAVFLGVNNSGPATLISAVLSAKGNGCAGIGRDIHDCPTNSTYFADTGFHKDFRDGHNQPYHVWGYIANSSSSNLYESFGGVLIGVAGNYFHEGVQGTIKFPESGWGTSWEDYTLSYKGMFIGVMVSTNMIPPSELGGFVLQFLGPNGSGSNGFTEFYQRIYGPLPGSPK